MGIHLMETDRAKLMMERAGAQKEERTSAGESCIVRDCTAKNLHQRSGRFPGTGRKWSDRNAGGTQTARWKHEIHQQPGDSRKTGKKSGTDTGKTGKNPIAFCKG